MQIFLRKQIYDPMINIIGSFETNLLYLTVQVYPEILFRVPDILIPNSSELYREGSFYVGENMSSLCMYSVEL